MDDDSDSKPEDRPADVVLLQGATEDGAGYRGLRAREGRLEVAEIRPTRDGQPLQGAELVTLHPRPQFPLLCDVEVLYRREAAEPEKEPAASGTRHEGPARVSSRSYRKNWDQVFRGAPRPRKREPPN